MKLEKEFFKLAASYLICRFTLINKNLKYKEFQFALLGMLDYELEIKLVLKEIKTIQDVA